MHAALYVLALVAAPHAAAFLPRADDGPVHLTLLNTEPRQHNLERGYNDAVRRFALHRRQGDSFDASLTNHFQQRYSVKVSIGTPPQDFLLAFDTGSPGLWVYDSGCTPESCGTQSGGFDAATSSSYTLNNRTGLRPGVQFINSYCHGLWGWDTVVMGSTKAPQAVGQSAEAYPFLRCTDGNVTQSIYEPPGVIGFSWPIPNYPDPLWTFLVKDWKDKRFGVYLAHQNKSSLVPADPNGGVLTLGGVNTALFTGEINYVPNVPLRGGNNTFWAVMVDSASVGTSTSAAQATLAIVDTGTPLSGVPPAVYNGVYAGVSGMVLLSSQTGIYVFPCESAGAVSPLELTLGGVKYTIPAEDLYRAYPPDTSFRLPGFTPGPSGQICTTQLQQLDPAHGYDWMFGDVILRNLYQVYQYDPPAIGFARVADGADAAVAAAGGSGSTSTPTSAGVGVGGAAATATGFGADTTPAAATGTAAPTAARLPGSARPLLAGAGAVLLGVGVSLLIA